MDIIRRYFSECWSLWFCQLGLGINAQWQLLCNLYICWYFFFSYNHRWFLLVLPDYQKMLQSNLLSTGMESFVYAYVQLLNSTSFYWIVFLRPIVLFFFPNDELILTHSDVIGTDLIWKLSRSEIKLKKIPLTMYASIWAGIYIWCVSSCIYREQILKGLGLGLVTIQVRNLPQRYVYHTHIYVQCQ